MQEPTHTFTATASMSSSSMRTIQQIPASTILAPRELKHYRKWQRLYSDLRPAEQGFVPTASEYDDFQQWLKRQNSGSFSHVFTDRDERLEPLGRDHNIHHDIPLVAALCRHSIHPVALRHREVRCPVCTIDVHISYMRVLQQALDSAGGRTPLCTPTASEHQDNAYNAWLVGKVSTLKQLTDLERLADEEAEWSILHPDAALGTIQTAKKALHVYWSGTEGFCQSSPSHSKMKTVRFAQDTVFQPGRASAYFWKRSPRYEPGRYGTSGQRTHYIEVTSDDSDDYSSMVPVLPQECLDYDVTLETEQYSPNQYIPQGLDQDDSDGNWEDVDVDEEESAFGQEFIGCNYLYGVREESDFVVFSDD